jgi:hypothetical protein
MEHAGPKHPRVKKPQNVCIDYGSDGLNHVESQAVAVRLVGVDDPETGVQAKRQEGDSALNLGQRVSVVEHGVDWIGCPCRRFVTYVAWAATFAKHSPTLGHFADVERRESAFNDRRPRREVCMAGDGFHGSTGLKVLSILQLNCERADSVTRADGMEMLLADVGLSLQLFYQQELGDGETNV